MIILVNQLHHVCPAKLDAGLVAGAVALPNGNMVKKAVFSGKAFAEVEITTATKIISVLT